MASPQQPAPDQQPGQTSQAAQVALALLVAAAIAKLWPHLLANPDRRPAFKAAVAQEVIAHSQMASSVAVEQYAHQRQLAGARGRFQPLAADPPTLDEIGAMVDEALAGVDLADPDALTEAQDHLGAASGRMVAGTGARTVLENVARDRQARGYARVPEAGACSFCLLLASRGPVYKYDRAGRVANGRGANLTLQGIKKGQRHGDGDSFAASNAKFTGTGTIKVHDNCECHPEPVFGAYEPPARVRAADAIYVIASRGRGGKSARDAYRAAIEGFTNDKHGSPYFTDEQAARIAALRKQL